MTFLALLQKETMGVSFPLFPIVGPIVKLYHHRPSILHLVDAVYKVSIWKLKADFYKINMAVKSVGWLSRKLHQQTKRSSFNPSAAMSQEV